jgi:ABC-type dipeptide/oligopeptide/nickel transport system permease component
MTDPRSPLGSVVRAVNLGSSGIDKIKLEGGVVGKLASTQMGLYVICFGALGAGAWLQNSTMVFSSLGVAACAYVFGSLSSMIFASRHPDLALLEGAELDGTACAPDAKTKDGALP